MTDARIDIRIAARGWQHQSWQGDFYPSDLPADWRLSFYSNEFRALVVPVEVWAAADLATVGSWLEETHGDFLFFPELCIDQLSHALTQQKLALLATQLGGTLLHAPASQLAELPAAYRQAEVIAPSSVVHGGAVVFTGAAENSLRQQAVNLAWRIDEPAHISLIADTGCTAESALQVIQLGSNIPWPPRSLRETMEAGLRCVNSSVNNSGAQQSRIMLLMFEGDAVDISTMRAAGIISELLEMPSAE